MILRVLVNERFSTFPTALGIGAQIGKARSASWPPFMLGEALIGPLWRSRVFPHCVNVDGSIGCCSMRLDPERGMPMTKIGAADVLPRCHRRCRECLVKNDPPRTAPPR